MDTTGAGERVLGNCSFLSIKGELMLKSSSLPPGHLRCVPPFREVKGKRASVSTELA